MAAKNSDRHGGKGHGANGRGNAGRGHSYNVNRGKATKVGLCKELEGNIFDYGSKGCADQMRMTQEKIVQYAATKYGGDIAKELQNRTKVVIVPPEYAAHIQARHAAREAMMRSQQNNLLAAYQSKLKTLQWNAAENPDADVEMDIARVHNDIIKLEFEMSQEVEVVLSEKEKSEYRLDGKTYTDQVNKLSTHREHVFGLIMGQCTQLLQDKMKQDPNWITVSKSYDPLELYSLIERVILKQTDDQYPFAGIYEQIISVFNGKQGNMTNVQWYERFNTRVDVAKSVGVTFEGYETLWDYCAGIMKTGATFSTLTSNEKTECKRMAEDRYLAYIFVQNSGNQHETLCRELQNDFTNGSDRS